MLKQTLKYSFFFLLFTSLTCVVVSCRKKDTTCSTTITVTDVSSARIQGAKVLLYATLTGGGTGDIKDSTLTDASGQAQFHFKLQAIFNVEVSKGALTGTGIVKLEPGENVEKTIIIQ